MNEEQIIYNYIEFFFSKDDLKSMMMIHSLDYESWLNTVDLLYSDNEPINGFHYNIMRTDSYITIIKCIKEIKEKIKNGINNRDKDFIKNQIIIIEREYVNLYYYDQIYVYAHNIFNKLRSNGLKIQGGGEKNMTLEDFKQIIRDKIKNINT
jgi:hypothetical protein